jgi:hypothetical protein
MIKAENTLLYQKMKNGNGKIAKKNRKHIIKARN